MPEFLTQNASAVFALAGALGGALLSFAGAWLLKRRDLQLRLYEKVTERRLASHDAVIALAKDFRKTGIAYGKAKSMNERAPLCFCSHEDFDAFNVSFALTMVQHTTWLSAALVRELHLVQDYLANVQVRIREIGTQNTFQLGCILREDFIGFSQRIEHLAVEYYAHIERLAPITPPSDPHYPKHEREARLSATALFQRSQDIQALRNAS